MTSWGAQPLEDGQVRFSLWAPDRNAVTLVFEDGRSIPMQPGENGWFELETHAEHGDAYKFRLDNDVMVPDPASRRQAGGVHGWSLVLDHDTFAWSHPDWSGRPFHESVIYEVHTGLYGGFRGTADHLAGLRDLGITAIELMPIGAFSGGRNWGYDGVLPYAPVEAYGTPADLKYLVDTAHGLGLSIYLDVVYNHFGPEGNFLGQYARDFFDHDNPNTWGDSVAVDREAVARYFIDNALMWLRDYRFDGLRFDAVHAIGNPAFLDRMGKELRAACPDRHIHLMLENEENDADRLPGPFDAQWNDDFHNVLHVMLTGETDAYYADFAHSSAEKLARCLKDGFIYQGEESENKKGMRRGKPSGHLPPTAFVTFLQNHDQTGNRAFGERLTALTPPEKLRAATTLLLLSPAVPMIFMGDMVGATSPFFFFTDFHEGLAEKVREGRRKEFADFPALSDPVARARIPDPNALETFERSRPQMGPDGAQWLAFYKELLELRHTHLVPNLPGAVAVEARALTPRAVFAQWRLGNGALLTTLFSLDEQGVTWEAQPVDSPLYAVGTTESGPGCTVWLTKDASP